jgi:hypothetical protein
MKRQKLSTISARASGSTIKALFNRSRVDIFPPPGLFEVTEHFGLELI